MRIRHVVGTMGSLPLRPDRSPASGVVGAALSIAVEQARDGDDVEAWGWSGTSDTSSARWAGVDLWSSRAWSWARVARWDLRWLAPLALHAAASSAVDVLHTYSDVNLLYLPRARARVLHLQTPVPGTPPASYHRALDRADAVICCSDFIRRSFLSSTDYRADRTHVVYNGADPTAYRAGEGALQRQAWGLTAHDFVLLFAGAIVPEKGVLELVRAFAQARTSVANPTLVIAGSGALWALLEGSVAADRYEDKVRQMAQGMPVEFVGALPRDVMPGAFMAADVVVVPSIWQEPLGTVVCEAMAAGRPVIASRSGGLAETVVDGETGILIEPGDVDALAHAIVRLAKDPDLRRRMADAARQRAALFTWRAAADRLRPIYTEILAAR